MSKFQSTLVQVKFNKNIILKHAKSEGAASYEQNDQLDEFVIDKSTADDYFF